MWKVNRVFILIFRYICVLYHSKNRSGCTEELNIDKYKQSCVPSELFLRAINSMTGRERSNVRCTAIVYIRRNHFVATLQ